MQIKKQQLEPDMEQWTGSKLGKEYVKAVYCHLAYLTYTQSVCVLSLFSRVRLFATPWTITSSSSVHGILQARILEWVIHHVKYCTR